MDNINVIKMREIALYDTSVDDESFVSKYNLMHGDVFMVFEYCDYDLFGILHAPGVVCTVVVVVAVVVVVVVVVVAVVVVVVVAVVVVVVVVVVAAVVVVVVVVVVIVIACV